MKIAWMGLFVFAVAAALAGCEQKPDEVIMGRCWDASAKTQLVAMAKENMVEKIATLFNQSGAAIDDETKNKISGRLEVTASNYYVVSIDRLADSVHCGAQVGMRYNKLGGQTSSADGAMVDFNVYRGENGGSMFSIPSTIPLYQLVSEALGGN